MKRVLVSENGFSRIRESVPVLNMKGCCHVDRYSIKVQVPSLFQDNTVSWVRIVSGVENYVTESMPTAKEEDVASGKTHC